MKKSIWLLLIVISVIVTIVSAYTNTKLVQYVFKPLSTLLVIIIPILFAKNGLKPYKNIILIGLVFCLIGDVFLMFDSYFIFGLVAFLIGHIFFIYAFTTINGISTNIKTLVPLVALACLVFFILKDHLGSLLVPVILYIACIVFMVWQALNLYVWKKDYAFLLILLGGILFLISDSVLAYRKFIFNFTIAQFLVSTTYWLAITLISLSTIYINDKARTSI
ncbi:lysoplasmalogenase [Algibacter sp. PT7-4]|uniref:lysoplasmalogenase n=1 Tax=Algibacter ulvanivorans TaxID=3400999 RepID=UPI003AADE419